MIELNKPNWTALPKKASLTAEDLTPHYTLTKISDNNYHFFNAETKSGQVLSTQEAIHKLAHLSGKLLSKEHIKAIESLASFDSMIVPTSAVRPSRITTTASAETMSVDPWKLIEVNGTKYFIRNTEDAETIEKKAFDVKIPTNEERRKNFIPALIEKIKTYIANAERDFNTDLTPNFDIEGQVAVAGTDYEALNAIKSQLDTEYNNENRILQMSLEPVKTEYSTVRDQAYELDIKLPDVSLIATSKEGLKVTASAHNHGHLYTIVAHTRGITESGLIVKACDCCCQKQKDETYKNISVNFDLNEPEKVSFNMNFDGPKEELLAFIQEQVQKLGVLLPNDAFDVSTANCTCPMCAQPEQQALFILETPETAKVSAANSLDTLKTYAKAHYKEYTIKDKNLNVVASHMDNIKKEATFAESLSDMLMDQYKHGIKASTITKTAKEFSTANEYIQYLRTEWFRLKKEIDVFIDTRPATLTPDVKAQIRKLKSDVSVYYQDVLDARKRIVDAQGNTPRVLYAMQDGAASILGLLDQILLGTKSSYNGAIMTTASDIGAELAEAVEQIDQAFNEAETLEFADNTGINTEGSSYTNQETGETKELPDEVEEKLNPTKEPIMTVKTNGVEEVLWKNNN